jgi:hypothetical protein
MKLWRAIPQNIRKRIAKKLEALKADREFRHMRFGLPYFVLEINQYRVCFYERECTRTLLFVGNHKEYEKWYLSKMQIFLISDNYLFICLDLKDP